jgi:PHD-finger
VRVLGDSQLIMRFMLRIYRQPRKPFLYQVVQDVRKLVRQQSMKVAFRHVPRRLNSIPDAMCREAFAAKANVHHFGGQLPDGLEPLDLPRLYEAIEADATQCTIRPREINSVCAAWDEHLRGKPCAECATLRGEADMVVCDRCEDCYHTGCANIKGYSPVHQGPWYCFKCRGELFLTGWGGDPIEDVPLLDFLFLGKLPKDHDEEIRVLRAAKQY